MRHINLLYFFLFLGIFLQDAKKMIAQDTSVFRELYKQEIHRYEQVRSVRRTIDPGEYDILHNILYLQLDPKVNYISGNVKAIFKTKKELDSIGFDLHQNLTVDSVFYGGSKIQSAHKGNKLTVFF